METPPVRGTLQPQRPARNLELEEAPAGVHDSSSAAIAKSDGAGDAPPYARDLAPRRFVLLDELWELIQGETEFDDILRAIDRAKALSKTRKVIIAKIEGVKYLDMSYWGPEGWSPTTRQRVTHTARRVKRTMPRHRPMSP